VKKLQFLEADTVLSYAGNIQSKLSIFFLFESAICQLVTLHLFTIALYCNADYWCRRSF